MSFCIYSKPMSLIIINNGDKSLSVQIPHRRASFPGRKRQVDICVPAGRESHKTEPSAFKNEAQ